MLSDDRRNCERLTVVVRVNVLCEKRDIASCQFHVTREIRRVRTLTTTLSVIDRALTSEENMAKNARVNAESKSRCILGEEFVGVWSVREKESQRAVEKREAKSSTCRKGVESQRTGDASSERGTRGKLRMIGHRLFQISTERVRSG